MGTIFALAFLNFYGLNGLTIDIKPANFNNGKILLTQETKTPTIRNELDLLFLFPRKSQTSTSVSTAHPENAPHPTAGPGFGTPVGDSAVYLIHQVAAGESLHYLEDLYNTSAEAISTINCLPTGFPIVVNQVLVIKPGETGTDNLGCFTAVNIKEDTPLETIAIDHAATLEVLSKLNDLGEIKIIPAGRWLIIPAN